MLFYLGLFTSGWLLVGAAVWDADPKRAGGSSVFQVGCLAATFIIMLVVAARVLTG